VLNSRSVEATAARAAAAIRSGDINAWAERFDVTPWLQDALLNASSRAERQIIEQYLGR
jgi:hypothetical protein